MEDSHFRNDSQFSERPGVAVKSFFFPKGEEKNKLYGYGYGSRNVCDLALLGQNAGNLGANLTEVRVETFDSGSDLGLQAMVLIEGFLRVGPSGLCLGETKVLLSEGLGHLGQEDVERTQLFIELESESGGGRVHTTRSGRGEINFPLGKFESLREFNYPFANYQA